MPNIFDKASTDVFDNMDQLRDEFIPEDILHREEQIGELRSALLPAMNGDTPSHAFLFGPNGTGKSVTSRYVTQQLKDAIEKQNEELSPEDTQDITVVYASCANCTSEYEIMIKVANQMLPEEDQLSPQGYMASTVVERLFEAINQQGDVVVLILDEVGRAKDLNNLFYQASRPGQPGTHLDGTRLSIIATANNLKFRKNFSAAVESSLIERSIEFPSYNADELREILEMRAETAFTEQGITEAAVHLTAARAAQCNGDARYGLTILLRAGEIAMSNGESPVTEEHIEEAREHVDQQRISASLSSYASSPQYIIAALAHIERHADDPDYNGVAGTEIKQVYHKICEDLAVDPVSNSTFYRRLSEFTDTELVEQRSSEGTKKRYKLIYSPDRVIESLDQMVRDALRQTPVITE